jgi:hypothetical protein
MNNLVLQLEALRHWTDAIVQLDYASAAAILDAHISKFPTESGPVASHIRNLLRMTREWSESDFQQDPAAETVTTHCSFCGHSQQDREMIAGPGVFICGPCVRLCAKALEKS